MVKMRLQSLSQGKQVPRRDGLLRKKQRSKIIMLFYSTRSLVLVIGGKRGRGGNILVQADRLRRPKVVIHVWCVLRALQRTQNTPNVYKRTICGAAATCTGLLPLQKEETGGDTNLLLATCS